MTKPLTQRFRDLYALGSMWPKWLRFLWLGMVVCTRSGEPVVPPWPPRLPENAGPGVGVCACVRVAVSRPCPIRPWPATKPSCRSVSSPFA
jgi:hypothetical protein